MKLTCLCCDQQTIQNQPRNAEVLRKTGRTYNERFRCVQAEWFNQYPWLALCETENKLFCFVCKQAEQLGLFSFSKNVEKCFSQRGFQNWKKATTQLKEHGQSKAHTEAALKINCGEIAVDVLLDRGLLKEQDAHRKGIVCLIESIQHLLRQGLAVRGHENKDGNLIQLLKVRAKDIPDVTDWMIRGNKYTSPEIVNEMLT